MKEISVAIATFNEEENIGKCLESVADWTDEIVMVDGSSADRTMEIAKKYKAKVIVAQNPSNFHINKQKAINACKSDWILQLDADEVVSDELKKELLRVINHQASRPKDDQPLAEINGYWIPRKNYFLGKFLSKGGQYPDYSLRLYRRGKGKLPCKNVHEQAQVEGKVAYLKSPLLHYPYPDFTHYLEHFGRYTDIFADELQEQNLKLSLIQTINYLLIRPLAWFLKTYVRHKGFVDGFAGFLFSFFSALRFPVSYIKYGDKLRNKSIK